MATWPRRVTLLVIISNDIPLSLPIALTYHLIPIGLHSQYTKSYPSIVGNRLSYIALLRSAPAVILLLRSAPSVIVLCWDLLLLLLLLFPPYNHWVVGYTSLLRIKPPAGTRRAWWPIARLAGRSKYGTVGNRRLDLWGERIIAWILSDDWSGHYERVWSLGMNDKALRDDSRIVGTRSALGPEGLGLGALNRMVCWETD